MARLLCSGSRCNSRYLNVHMQAQKEAEALRVAVATQVRERAVAAQAQARLAAARKQIKALEWSSEVCTSSHTELMYRFLGVHACAASHTGKHVQKGLQSVQCKDEGLQLSKRCYYVALCTAHPFTVAILPPHCSEWQKSSCAALACICACNAYSARSDLRILM